MLSFMFERMVKDRVIPTHKLLLCFMLCFVVSWQTPKSALIFPTVNLKTCSSSYDTSTPTKFLNGDNVMQVFYLAEKYIIPNLTKECFYFLRDNLDTFNVFCVLKRAIFF